jgi:hypothetical protein
MASPQFFVSDNFSKCPLCKGDPKTCPHSLGAMAERLWEEWVRKIAREEVKRAGQVQSKHSDSQVDDRSTTN